MELGGIVYGQYTPAPPSETAAHVPHPPDGARSHLSSAPALCRFPPVQCCCTTPTPESRAAKAAASIAPAAAVPPPTASPSTAAVAAVAVAAAAAATKAMALMRALALAAVPVTAAVEAAAVTRKLASATITLAQALAAVAITLAAVGKTLAGAAVLTNPPSLQGVPAPPAATTAPGILSPHAAGSSPTNASLGCSQVTSRESAGRTEAGSCSSQSRGCCRCSLRLRFCLVGPLHVVEPRFQEGKQPRERCPAVEVLIRGEHVRPIPYPCCHVKDVRSIGTRFRPERPCRRQGHATEQTTGLQARCHPKLKRHSNATFDHAVVLWRVDGRVLATNAMAIEQCHELGLR